MADRAAEDITAQKPEEATARAMPLRDPRLRSAAVLIQRLQENPHAPYTRAAALHALEAVTDMVRGEIPELDLLALLAPLDHLHAALRNLDAGDHPAMLEPVKRSGRAPSNATTLKMKAMVAITVDCLCDLDDSATPLIKRRQRACAEIADVLTECGIKPQRAGAKDQRGIGTVTARTVRGWFDEVMQTAKNSPLAHSYNSLRELNKWSPVQQREAMLAIFGDALPAPELVIRWRRARLSFLRAWVKGFST